MGRRLTDALTTAHRWLARHWSTVWLPLAVALVIGLGAAFIYVVPMQLVHRDNASTPDSLTKARHDDRATLLQSLVGLLALFGAISALRQIRVTREGQITDRYTKAIDQLGNKDALAVRLGGLYALERIARDSVPDRATIAEVLCAYARTAPRPAAATLISLSVRAPDVQAAVTILGRWQARLREAPPNVALQGADLEGAYFGGAQLQRAHFAGAQLQRANFGSAQLQGAYFGGAQLQGASFIEARLEETSFFPVPGRTQADANTSWPEGFDWQAAGIERRDT
jgi:hypothetical protein